MGPGEGSGHWPLRAVRLCMSLVWSLLPPPPPTRQPPLSLLQAAFFVIKWLSHFSSRQDYVKGENQLLLYLKLNDRRQVGGAGNCLLKIIQTSTTISQP